MSFRTRRNRGGKRRSLKGGSCPFAEAAAANSAVSGGGRRSRHGKRHSRRRGSRKHRGSRKRRGGLSSQIVPWTLLAGVLGLSKRKSHKRKSHRKRR
jgi:hypothetical protein